MEVRTNSGRLSLDQLDFPDASSAGLRSLTLLATSWAMETSRCLSSWREDSLAMPGPVASQRAALRSSIPFMKVVRSLSTPTTHMQNLTCPHAIEASSCSRFAASFCSFATTSSIQRGRPPFLLTTLLQTFSQSTIMSHLAA